MKEVRCDLGKDDYISTMSFVTTTADKENSNTK